MHLKYLSRPNNLTNNGIIKMIFSKIATLKTYKLKVNILHFRLRSLTYFFFSLTNVIIILGR
jgi:ABC-type uncharacterized transport system permease subunit